MSYKPIILIHVIHTYTYTYIYTSRALLKDPTLILCDEVTSAVDAFAERDITDSLRKACESRTTITIAHRLSSIIHCDKIIVMQNGHIVEEGNHEQLLLDTSGNPTNGVYSRMWQVQNNLNFRVSATDPEYAAVL